MYLLFSLQLVIQLGILGIDTSLQMSVLTNVNLNFVNLNTLTLCLSIYNRMTPPTQHPLYPLLEVEYDDQHRAHILSVTDAEVVLPPLSPARTLGHTSGTSVTRRPYGVPASSSLFVLSTMVFRPLIQHYLLQLQTGASAFVVRKHSYNKFEVTNSRSILITGEGLRPTHSTYLAVR